MSDPTPQRVDFCVIGVGFAGLRVAAALERAGADYIALDKGRSPGGRAATRRISEARVDHGIPWLTRTGGLSDKLIDHFRELDLIERLFLGGSVGDAWSSPTGVNALAKELAKDLNVSFSQQVEWIEPPGAKSAGASIRAAGPDGEITLTQATHTIITAPVPQAIEMAPFLASQTQGAVPEEVYEKAVLGLARLPHSSALPDQALFEDPAEGIESVVLESVKFIDRPPSVSIRCDPTASEELFDTDDELVWEWFSDRLSHLPFLAAKPEERQVKKWRYSRPAKPVEAPFIALAFPLKSGTATISACGDGFQTDSNTGLEAALASAQALLDRHPWQA